MYGECWFTGKNYFKNGGSQNATLTYFGVNYLLCFTDNKYETNKIKKTDTYDYNTHYMVCGSTIVDNV